MLNSVRDVIQSELKQFHSNLWKEPLVSVLSTQNEQFRNSIKMIHKNHLFPEEILEDCASIIVFFIPFEKSVVESNVKGTKASREWANAYIQTNSLIARISDSIEHQLNTHGYTVGKIAATHNFDETTLVSNWSHRHVAYFAGLGTFGMNNMLITDSGCCGRLGSIVTNFEFDSYTSNIQAEKCLFKIDGSCDVCRQVCVSDAYGKNEFDRFDCYQVCLSNAAYHSEIGYADVCGKCLVGLPCSTKKPSITI